MENSRCLLSSRQTSLTITLLAFAVLSIQLVKASTPPDTPLPKQVGLLENRFFYHLYYQDPIEKRLERLELLVFGATQPGTSEERLARLKKSVADRDSQASQSNQTGSVTKKVPAQPQAPTAATKPPETSSQYPILNTLEWRVLKKTYPTDSLDKRLERMENTIFGQPSPAMAYFDRIERLKKTVGVGIAEETPPANKPLGPKPKARPRFDDPSQMPDNFGMMPPNMMPMPIDPFQNPAFGGMFHELNKQMQEMMKMPPGSYIYDPKTGQWIEQDTGRKLSPNTGPPAKEPVPQQKLPSYYDPNSI